MILILKHIAIEGPGTLGEFLARRGFQLKILELQQGQKLPSVLSDVEAVVSLGGPMNVYQEDKYSFLKTENAFIQDVLQNEIPFLGICLGSQLLSKAAGAKVVKSPAEEIGWFKIQLTAQGRNDLLFEGINPEMEVFQWHGDTFEIPSDGLLLAQGAVCRNQALKVGRRAYGLQFHIEVTDEIIQDWARAYFSVNSNEFKLKAQHMVNHYKKSKGEFESQARKIYENFERIIREKR